jgi:hypothetical protein
MHQVRRILVDAVKLLLQPFGAVVLLHIHLLEIVTTAPAALRKSEWPRCQVNKKARDEKSDRQRNKEWNDPFNGALTAHVNTPENQ